MDRGARWPIRSHSPATARSQRPVASEAEQVNAAQGGVGHLDGMARKTVHEIVRCITAEQPHGARPASH